MVSMELGWNRNSACTDGSQHPMDQRTNRNNHGNALRCGDGLHGCGRCRRLR